MTALEDTLARAEKHYRLLLQEARAAAAEERLARMEARLTEITDALHTLLFGRDETSRWSSEGEYLSDLGRDRHDREQAAK